MEFNLIMKFSLMDYGLLTHSFNRHPQIFSNNCCLCLKSCQRRNEWNDFVIGRETNLFIHILLLRYILSAHISCLSIPFLHYEFVYNLVLVVNDSVIISGFMVQFGAPYHCVFGDNSDVLPNISLHYWHI
jgi:hypothetical protein